jgi:hypothetical protein
MMSAVSSMAGTPLAVKPYAAAGASSRRSVRGMRVVTASAETDAAAALKSSAYPFVKIVGQDELKLALILNVIVRDAPPLRLPPTPFSASYAACVLPPPTIGEKKKPKNSRNLPFPKEINNNLSPSYPSHTHPALYTHPPTHRTRASGAA